ncbi:MAG: glycosyltransferase family A protein [Bacteroidia bacterium]|nr:glycosyltransferase family 2 protein [Bacteroidia bacterium]MDW8014679.1 glycosyltransferase family A protein [Bacteroidia bacterium]
MSRVAVVIPTYNNLSELRLCLAALTQQTYQDFTAYVCVDGSTDGTQQYLQQVSHPNVVMLQHGDGRNHGRNATRNLILPYLERHEWVAFLDSDSLPLPTWLEAFFAVQPLPSEVLLGRILYFSEDNPHPWVIYLRWREQVRASQMAGPRHFITINAFMPAEVMRRIGGMDPNIKRYGLGDVEFGYRLAAAGMRFRYIAAATVWSRVQQSLSEALIRLYDMAQHNLPYLHQKHPSSRDELFGGKWLYQSSRRFLLQLFMQPFIARWILQKVEGKPAFIQRWLVRYLVFYAVARGFWKRKLGLPPLKRLRPFP